MKRTTNFKSIAVTLSAIAIGLAGAQAATQSWRIDNTSATWTGANWSNTGAAPFTSAWVQNSDVVFSAASTVTFATTNVGNISVLANTTVTQAGTLQTGGNVRTVDVANGVVLTWTGQAISTTGSTGFIKSGAGTWNMGAYSGAYTGGFTLNAGRVIVSGNQAFGTGPLTINGGTAESSGTRTFQSSALTIGGDFELAGTGNANWGTGNMAIGASTRTITNNTASGSRQFLGIISGSTGAGLTFSGTGLGQGYVGNTGNTFSGPVTINGGEVVFNDNGSFGNTTSITLDGGRLTMASMTTAGATSALTAATIASSRNIFVGDTVGTSISIQSATGTTTYNGTIADKAGKIGTWAKQGAGTLVLGGTSTYSGDTSINNGTVLITASNALPTGSLINIGQASNTNTGLLDLNGFNLQVAGLTSTAGNATTTGTNTVNSASAATLTLGGSGTYNYGIAGSGSNSGNIGGAISLVKTGNGTQTIGGSNSFTGSVTVNAGTLALSATNAAFGSTSGSVTAAGGVLDLGGLSVTKGALTVSGGTIQSGTLTSSGTIAGQSGTVSAVLAGSGVALTKTTSGTLTLSGNNTYTGATTVSAGTLIINGSNAGSAVTVGNGGVLGGSATVGALTVQSGGTLAPGNSPGIVNSADFALNTGSFLSIELTGSTATPVAGSNYDQVNVTGGVTLGGSLVLSIYNSYSQVNGALFFIVNNDSNDAVSGTFFNLAQGGTTTISGNQFQISYTGDVAGGTFTGGNDVVLMAIPEPQTWALIGLGLAFSLWGIRGRRKRA